MSGEAGLLGVTAVDAGDIEAEVLAKAHAGEAPAPAADAASDDPAALLQQLHAVHRELRTVGAAVRSFQQQADQAEQQQQQQEEDGEAAAEPEAEAGRAPGSVHISAAGGTLQQAVMQQRLADLQARRQQLEEGMRQLGVEPPAAPAPASIAAGPSRGKRLASAPGKQAAAEPAKKGGAAGSKRKKGKKVQFAELEEADLFEDAGAAPGGGDAAAGLVETERDRLIRLVRGGVSLGCLLTHGI